MAIITNNNNNNNKNKTKLCKPSLIYIIVAIIAIIAKLTTGILLVDLILIILYNIMWVVLLNWLCQKGYSSFSWGLVIIPILVVPIATYYAKKKNTSSSTTTTTTTTDTDTASETATDPDADTDTTS